ncbi:chromodomain-helicase-DNA-binding protein 8-like [Notothenia coriiceps]|uniref:Chromodomain-helicase-DNA-binding protein 8-like n=1 Tax=Notothenia coriiceps TaxID=8208 RepID=A0A6I9NMC4_9TELE|nr:PREDICTED: chromodomain-helicase-DNA-binding protein 8-like [Notothenia coriiceps]
MICSKRPSRMVAAPCGTCSIRKDHASPHQTPDQELVNLTAADTCVIFDSDWNPQNDLQAQARCHRFGQSKAVKVYRLITRNYDREMLDKASLKLGLDRAVLQSMSGNKKGNNNPVQQFSKKEIKDLLRKGAYAAIMDENDEGNRFC